MSYDLDLAERVRKTLGKKEGLAEKQMFGGLCFLLHGHMCCGIVKKQLVVRVGLEDYDRAIADPDVRPMDFTGRPLRGFVYVRPQGLRDHKSLEGWIDKGLRYAGTLPKKGRVK